MKMKLMVLLALGWALSSMVVPVSRGEQPEMKIDSIVKSDSVKYIIFTSSDSCDDDSAVYRMWSDKGKCYSYFFKDVKHNEITFDVPANASPIVKPKSFLQTIEYVDWNVLFPRLSASDAAKMYSFFVHECHQWKRKGGKETRLYFIDRKDFSRDSIKIYRVYCRNSQYYKNELLDELEY
ncbi:MAG: hypothetical protein BHV81_08465 [Butyricimonas synergistica]|nr:MAG: hypothetical protein BHV81_08465 [Butyricimonas synergistica]